MKEAKFKHHLNDKAETYSLIDMMSIWNCPKSRKLLSQHLSLPASQDEIKPDFTVLHKTQVDIGKRQLQTEDSNQPSSPEIDSNFEAQVAIEAQKLIDESPILQELPSKYDMLKLSKTLKVTATKAEAYDKMAPIVEKFKATRNELKQRATAQQEDLAKTESALSEQLKENKRLQQKLLEFEQLQQEVETLRRKNDKLKLSQKQL